MELDFSTIGDACHSMCIGQNVRFHFHCNIRSAVRVELFRKRETGNYKVETFATPLANTLLIVSQPVVHSPTHTGRGIAVGR